VRISSSIRPGVPAARHTPDSPTSHDWRHDALCADPREGSPELWFPIGNTGPSTLQTEAAKAVCRRCPVMDQCLQWALANPRLADHGVWGGLSEDERRNIRRRATRTRQNAADLGQEAAAQLADIDELRRDVVRALWAARHTDAEIAPVLGLTRQAVGHIRRKLGLEAHRGTA
jgi:WhiB family transcriptional regulator, redox-sensing transcriptional regulator